MLNSFDFVWISALILIIILLAYDVIDGYLGKKVAESHRALKPWETVEFSWGIGIRHRKGEWETVVLKPDGFVIDVRDRKVILHDNGIEFVEGEK